MRVHFTETFRPEARLFLVLRIGVALCFIGHGAFGILRKEAWLVYFRLFGIGPDLALPLMPLVGSVDILIGVLALAWPAGVVFAYAFGWALMTATLRPLAGEGVWELLERAGNYGVPVAALLLASTTLRVRGWLSSLNADPLDELRTRHVLLALRWTTVLLLLGHGALALQGKPLLLAHGAAVGAGPALVQAVGAAEILLAFVLVFSRSPALFLAVALWKLASEGLFVVAGDAVWEWIERGGSYVAPLAAAWLLARSRRSSEAADTPKHRAPRQPAAVSAALMLVLLAPAALAAQQAPPRVDAEVLQRLRQGGLILACRHAITDPDAPGTGPQFEVRPITEEGERQARRMGELIQALGIPIGEVLSSPYVRNLRTAELAFGRAQREDALWTSNRRQELRPRLFSDPPSEGNRVLMTHQGVLYRQLPVPRQSIEEGDCVVLDGRRAEGFLILGQASNDDWERLLRERRRAGGR